MHVVEVCRGYMSCRCVVDTCRGCVSWMHVVEVIVPAGSSIARTRASAVFASGANFSISLS